MVWLMLVMAAVSLVALLLVWHLAGSAELAAKLAKECSDDAKWSANEARKDAGRAEVFAAGASATLVCAEELESDQSVVRSAPNLDQLSADERAVLAMAWEADAIGCALNLGCDAVKQFGLQRASCAVRRLAHSGLLYPVKGDEESQGGWCLTPSGRGIADEMQGTLEPPPKPDGKYGVIETTGKRLHSDEPVFLLRATDPFTPHAVRVYANYCGMQGTRIDHVKECHALAARIEEWQKANPALVKKLPD